ncbi:carboxylating nicotinate-nucleotide diphosphorylase [Candidatus Omnitrophota bacterium]
MAIDNGKLELKLKHSLEEDGCFQDITTKNLHLGDLKVEATIRAKEDGTLAGISFARQLFKYVDKDIVFKAVKKDGQRFRKGNLLAKVSGPAKSILSAERTALNFISRLSGIATLTRKFVDRVKPYKARIMDTRKTTPCLRLMEKYAVRMGGGYNHRIDLSEAILIKDNHIAALKKKFKGISLATIIAKIKKSTRRKELEIEVNSVKEFQDAFKYPPDIIMLDNMSPGQIRKCVKLRNRFNRMIKLEVSGGVCLSNVKKIARLGVDRISIGSLTHSPKAIDVTLEITS